jgi:TonB family protein
LIVGLRCNQPSAVIFTLNQDGCPVKTLAAAVAVMLMYGIAWGEDVSPHPGIRAMTCPAYPELGKTAGIAGDVRLAIRIAENGTVQSVKVLSGHDLLAKVARENIESWQFTPTGLASMRL